jgi:PilZ domain
MMHNASNCKLSGASGHAVDVLETERRGNTRHTFTAAAEVVELRSGARFSTRTTDLGPGGCFVDTVCPLSVGTKVRVTLQRAKTTFQTGGTVVYSQMGLGMGISFEDHDETQRMALGEWLANITGDCQIIPEIVRTAMPPGSHRGPERTSLVRLIQLMIGKGILTEAEGTSVLLDPLL